MSPIKRKPKPAVASHTAAHSKKEARPSRPAPRVVPPPASAIAPVVIAPRRRIRRRPGGPPVRRPASRQPTREESQERFLRAYLADGTIAGACRTSRVGRRTHYLWLDSDDLYAARFAEIHESVVDEAERELRRRGIDGVDEPVFFQGEKCGKIRRYSDACLIFYLKGRRGDVFRDRAEITGAGGGPIQTLDLSAIPHERLTQMRQWLLDAIPAESRTAEPKLIEE